MAYSPCITKLIEEFTKLPGIGAKTAERLAFHVLRSPEADLAGLVSSIQEVKRTIRPCSRCFSPGESDLCHVCTDPARDQGTLCVVEEPKDLLSIEKIGTYQGVYHVLLGSLSPMEGVEPDDLTISDLMHRAREGGVKEVILATNPTTEGDCTALYLAEQMQSLPIKVTRLARGIPSGSHLEFTSGAILGDALLGRTEFSSKKSSPPGGLS